MAKAIIDPSHLLRWRTGQLPALAGDALAGCGGALVWGDFLPQHIAKLAGGADQWFIMAGDFRFGNTVLDSEKFRQSGRSGGRFLTIEKCLINDDNDRRRLEARCARSAPNTGGV
jgi:hypothetical protein